MVAERGSTAVYVVSAPSARWRRTTGGDEDGGNDDIPVPGSPGPAAHAGDAATAEAARRTQAVGSGERPGVTPQDLARKQAIFAEFPLLNVGDQTLQQLKDWMIKLDQFYTEVIFNTQAMAGAFMQEWHRSFLAALDPTLLELKQKIKFLKKRMEAPGAATTGTLLSSARARA